MHRTITIHEIDIHDISILKEAKMVDIMSYSHGTMYNVLLNQDVSFSEVDGGEILFENRDSEVMFNRNDFHYIEVRYY